MAQEWYLLKSPYSQLSGYENEILDDFAEEGFAEALDSSMAVDVELCNYDLSVCTSMRAIIQNRVQDTKLKTLQRHLFVPIGTCKAGMYIKYKNRYWLIIGLVDDNGMYEKAVMILCNYYLTWLNNKGEVIQRWVNITSSSQYNNGEWYNKNYTLRSDQLLILAPDDDECTLLETDKRFVIDKRCKIYEKDFNKDVLIETSKPLIIYALSRIDNILYDYSDSGHSEFMVTQDEKRDSDGYYVIDGKGYWLCDIPTLTTNKTAILSCSIECESDEIYDGLEAGVFTAKFYDSEGNEVSTTPHWQISCDFLSDINIEYVGNSILISVDNEKLVNKSFELFLSSEGYEPTSIVVTIKAFL